MTDKLADYRRADAPLPELNRLLISKLRLFGIRLD